MTLAQFCLSSRANQLLRWQQAFPGGKIEASLERLESGLPENALVWAHADALPSGALQSTIARLCSHPRIKRIVVITSLPSPHETIAVLAAGAAGYCHALATPELFQRVAIVVSHGGVWVGSEILNHLTSSISRMLPEEGPTATPALGLLSSRERDVALQIRKGASNKEIAAALDITERTVKAHLGSIFNKLGIRDRLQLILLLSKKSI
jgi:two-component system, NarL family, nitrate/nitrite response regulator NarL